MVLESGWPYSWKNGAVVEAWIILMGLYKVPCGAGITDLGARAANDHVDALSEGVCLTGFQMDHNIL